MYHETSIHVTVPDNLLAPAYFADSLFIPIKFCVKYSKQYSVNIVEKINKEKYEKSECFISSDSIDTRVLSLRKTAAAGAVAVAVVVAA